MRTLYPKPSPPSDDKRWKMINGTMRRLGHSPNAVIETLHQVQEVFGYLEDDAIEYVAGSLRVSKSQVYGVATFYHYFSMKPQGEHSCVICTGTACYIKGVPDILQAIHEAHGIRPDETTEDNKASLMTARCVGACGLAPVVVYDGAIKGPVTPQDVVDRISEWRAS